VNQHQQRHTWSRVITLRRVQTSLILVSRVHQRLVSSIYVPSDPTSNIWRHAINRGTLERGEALRFVLVNSLYRGSTTRSSWQTCDSCSKRCHSWREKTTILSTRLKNRKSGARRPSASSSIEALRTRRPHFKQPSSNQLQQIWSMVQRDHWSGLHRRLPDYPG
jgi:hypothetical protein